MSIIEASDDRLESYFKRLGKFYGSAKSKAEGDEHKFSEDMKSPATLYFSDAGLFFVC